MREDSFKEFPKEREEGLKKLYRYAAFDVMFYRPNLWVHSHRVSWLTEELAPIAQKYFKKFDGEKARILALVHDDAELITGDIMSRAKARASKKDTQKWYADEARAIKELSSRYPKYLGEYSYRGLLTEALTKTSPESWIVTFADKLDAYCEGLHEVTAGNFSLLQCILFYSRIFGVFEKKFPKLAPFLKDRSSALVDLERYLEVPFIKSGRYLSFGKPFTRKTVRLSSTLPFYDRWRELVIEHWGEKGIEALITQKEFLSKGKA